MYWKYLKHEPNISLKSKVVTEPVGPVIVRLIFPQFMELLVGRRFKLISLLIVKQI